jgi:beta-galactosidase
MLAFLCALVIQAVASQPTYTNVIATETVSTQNILATWFNSLPVYHIPTDAVPASPAVPADSPARDLVFGAPLTFTVGPVNPASSFQVSMTFLDDAVSYHRRMALTIGSTTIAPAFTLPAQTIYTATYNVSSSTVSPQGHTLTFTLTASAGPNAILSSFTLYSSNPSDPALHPPQPPAPTHDLPRLTPTPATVQGTDTPTLPLMGTWAFNPSPSTPLLQAFHSRSPALISHHLGDSNWTTIAVPSEYTLQGFTIPPYAPVVYQTTVTVPPGWGGLRTKLKCDGVYSNATVFMNGGFVGGHLGGFTPFELDVTQWLSPSGQSNNLTIVVVGSSLADTLARCVFS